MQMVVALAPIHRAVGIERLVVSTYQSVSGTGQQRDRGAATSSRAACSHGDEPRAEVFPHQIAFNVLPQVETFKDGDDYTTEERKVMAETRKILGVSEEELGISATCARVPVFTGHSRVGQRADARAALARGVPRAALRGARRDRRRRARRGLYPLAIDVAGRDEVLVGRIRRDPSHERCLNLWVVGDNLRKGAATNAVQVAELLHRARPRPRPRRRRSF